MNFLARAVSGLENQLDKVLLDSEDGNVSKVHQKDTTSTSSQRRGSRDASPRRSGDAGSKARGCYSHKAYFSNMLTMRRRQCQQQWPVGDTSIDDAGETGRGGCQKEG